MKISLAAYDRWNKILFDIRRGEIGQKIDSELKVRIEDMCKILREIIKNVACYGIKVKKIIKELINVKKKLYVDLSLSR